MVEVVIPPDYPYDALQMHFREAYGISQHQIAYLQNQFPKKLLEKSGQRAGQYITLVDALQLLHSVLSG